MLGNNLNNSSGSAIRKGFIWSFVENISLQVSRFVIGIIMARLLTPTDYGLIGMLTVFIVISDLFVNSGIGAALNQKVNRTTADYSTAFYFNIVIGIFCYVILYFAAPFISSFYHEAQLTELLRWLSMTIVIKSMCVVPSTILQINMRFKAISIVALLSSLALGISGIIFATNGYGVWALVYSNLIGALFSLICYIGISKWMPKFLFSILSLKSLFGYGCKLLFATLTEVIYNNIYPLIIGRVYSAQELGYYSRAQGYANLPTGTLSSMIYRVCFPAFCKDKQDKTLLERNYNILMGATSYIIIPVMMLLLILARPLVIILITDKWLPCVVFLQILCLSTMWLPIMEVNYSIIKALGNSKAILRMQLLSKIFATIVLVITTRYGVEIMCIGSVVVSLFNLFINFILSRKQLSLSILQQFNPIIIPIIGGICMLPSLFILNIGDNIYLHLLFTLCVAVTSYIIVTSLMGLSLKKIIINIKNL